MRITPSMLLAFAMTLLSGAAQAGTYVYTPVGPLISDPFRSTEVQLSPINDAGIVVGSVSGQGMIWRSGVATPLASPPGTTFVAALGVTPYGNVLAQDRNADGTPGAYVYDSVHGRYAELAVPGLTDLTPVSISDNSNIAGYGTVPPAKATRAFAIVNRVGMILNPPGAASSKAQSVLNNGTVLGSAVIGAKTLGYFYRNGAYTVLDQPAASASSVAVVTPDGTAVGSFTVGAISAEYVFRNGVYTIIQPPGAITTKVSSISPDGTVVGSFSTITQIDGFTYKDGAYTLLDDPAAAAFPGYPRTTQATSAGPHGAIVGYYIQTIPGLMFEYRNGVFTNNPQAFDTNPTRILSDGRIFGVAWYSENPVPFIGTITSFHYLVPRGSFENDTLSVNRHGEFVVAVQINTGYYQTYIATCPAAQAPCDQVPAF